MVLGRSERQSRLGEDLVGGLVSAAVAIPLAMGYGMFAFGALGDSYFAHGAIAGLYASVIAGIVCVAMGDRSTMVYAPRVTTTFFLGTLLHQLVNSEGAKSHPDGTYLAILAFFAIILLGGALQALFGLLRLGSLLRFTPHPVMAGLQNSAAALLFLVQLGNVCGFDRNIPFTAVPEHMAEVRPLNLAVAATTFLVMWNARRITTKVPPLLVGIGTGTALYFGLDAAGFSAALGPVIGLPGAVERPVPVNHMDLLTDPAPLIPLLTMVVGGALALAFVASLDALLCAKLVTPLGIRKADGDRMLVRLGLGNALTACFGGITSGINIGPSIVNRAFGAKSAVSVLLNAAVLLAVVAVLFPAVSQMPRVVLSATIMVIAVQHVDPWSVDLVRRIRRAASSHRRMMSLDLVVVAVVAVLSVTVNIVLAVFIGVVIAIALFIARISRSNIRRQYRCDAIRSRRARTRSEVSLLERLGSQIAVLELQGVLFFGSAETLSKEIEQIAATGTRTVILDLRRVTEIDATGARILREIQLALAGRGQALALAVTPTGEVAAGLAETGVLDAIGAGLVFADPDRAIEWAEDEVLRQHENETDRDDLPLAAVDLVAGFEPAEIATLEDYLRRAQFPRETILFRQGDPGRELFIVTAGSASAKLEQASGGHIRLATFTPGTMFGEMAILDAEPRSATIVADDDVACFVLSEENFEALKREAPTVAMKVLANLSRELSSRLRRANRAIGQLEG